MSLEYEFVLKTEDGAQIIFYVNKDNIKMQPYRNWCVALDHSQFDKLVENVNKFKKACEMLGVEIEEPEQIAY